MFLNEYLNSIKTNDRFLHIKPWINTKELIKHFEEKKIPNKSTEEWKNFRTGNLNEVNWKIPQLDEAVAIDEEVKRIKNSIVLRNGFFDSNLSTHSDKTGINVIKTETYLKQNPKFVENLYNSPEKYAEKRLSGLDDDKPTSLLSLNSLLNTGIVIEVEANKKITETINIINVSSSNKLEMLISPYIILICNRGSEARFQEIYFNRNCWTNSFLEAYLEPNASLIFSRAQKSNNKSIKTFS